jgi:hypothetical protein
VKAEVTGEAKRRRPEQDRAGVTHKVTLFQSAGAPEATPRCPADGIAIDFFITLNRFEDGRPCEIFTKATHGYKGWCDAISRLVSVLLQHGVPVETICAQLAYASFAPCGMVPGFGMAHSFPDYLARWLVRENAEGLKGGKGSGGPATQGGRGPNAG